MPESLGSRSGDSGPFGKLTCKLDMFLSEATYEALIATAHNRGMTKSELARLILDSYFHGQIALTRKVSAKSDVLGSIGISEQPEKAA